MCCQTEYLLLHQNFSSSLPEPIEPPCDSPEVPPSLLEGVMEEYFNNFGGLNENCNIRLCVLKMKVCFGVIFTSTVAT